jgi:hypothetical protein
MKYLVLFFFGFVSIFCVSAQDASPDPFSYNNVARGYGNVPLAKRLISVQFKILRSSALGPIAYVESYQTSTNYFGIYELSLGNGTPQTGSFEKIDWNRNNYFLQVSIDTSGGSRYESIGEVTMLHMPSSYYGKIANDRRPGFMHYIGELSEGGVIFDIWKDALGKEHGLVAALDDQTDSIYWSNIDTKAVGPTARSMSNGSDNTTAIISERGHSNSAARLCRNYKNGVYHDWYLPSVAEMNLLYYNRNKVKKAFAICGHPIGAFFYWTSTEYSDANSWTFANLGLPSNDFIYSKYVTMSVRAIRAY